MRIAPSLDFRRLFGWTPYDFDLGKFFRGLRHQHSPHQRRAGKPMSKHEAQYAERRARRRAHIRAAVQGLQDGPAGSKRIKRFAKAAGFGVEEDGRWRRPTYAEALAWYQGLEEAEHRQGHQGFRIARQVGSPLVTS